MKEKVKKKKTMLQGVTTLKKIKKGAWFWGCTSEGKDKEEEVN